MKPEKPETQFTPPDQLGYDRSRTPLPPGEALILDEAYRLAHLPLVNPRHPDVIAQVSGKSYDRGIHPRIHSLVVPLPARELAGSAAFRKLEDTLRHSPFSGKIAWDIVAQRADRLHATLAGSLGEGDAAPLLPAHALAGLEPFKVRIQGLFSGTINRGRLYLKVYPEMRGGENVLHRIQRLLGRPPTDLYLIGLYNLTDHLTADETAVLATIIESWWSEPLLVVEVTELWLLSSCDDLVLDSRIEQRISLFSH